jgi:hypothetical protein
VAPLDLSIGGDRLGGLTILSEKYRIAKSRHFKILEVVAALVM